MLTEVVLVSDALRPVLVVGFVAGLFAAAGLAVKVGVARASRAQQRALAADTGLGKGKLRGSDATASHEWLAQTQAEQDGAPRQAWQDVVFGAGVPESRPQETTHAHPVGPAALDEHTRAQLGPFTPDLPGHLSPEEHGAPAAPAAPVSGKRARRTPEGDLALDADPTPRWDGGASDSTGADGFVVDDYLSPENS